MEAILSLIKTSLPSISDDLLQSLMLRLDLIGVANVEDLGRVTADDLEGILLPIQSRRLIRAFQTGQSNSVQSQSSTVPVESLAPATGETTGHFQIPWNKFPPALLKAIMENARPQPSLRRQMVRIIINEYLATEGKRPGRAVLRQVAHELVQKFPKSFCDTFGNNMICTGFDSLMVQLENRVDNCTRTSTARLKRPAGGDTGATKPKRYNQYGCVQWQPNLPATEDETSQTQKKKQMQNAYAKNMLPESCVKKLMAETYYCQRMWINTGSKTVAELKDNWPYLFKADHLFDHTHRLLGIPVQKKLAEELLRKGKTIASFLVQTKVTPSAGNWEKLKNPLELLSSIAQYLGDKIEVLLIKKESHNTTLLSLPETPCIIILGDEQYQVAVDRTVVSDQFRSPLTALSYLLSLFYVFNITYPMDAALSLEFIQRSLLGINPAQGTKVEQAPDNTKQHQTIHPKLLKFLSQVGNYKN